MADAPETTDRDVADPAGDNAIPGAAPGKNLPPAAIRALREAAERRAAAAGEQAPDQQHDKQKGETGGPKGPDPTRYGDWERKGRAVDFS